MITRYLKITVIIALYFFMNICSASATSITITPGHIDEDEKVTEEKIQLLHEYMNKEQYKTIIQDASEIAKNTFGKEAILNDIKDFHQELGNFVKADDKKINVIIGSPIKIEAIYVSTFEKGQVTELFIYIKDNGRDIKLVSYHILKAGDGSRFSKAIQTYPEAVLHVIRARIYYDMHDYDRAIINYDKAIELKPNSAASYVNRGIAYMHKNDSDKAIDDFCKAIELKPGWAATYYNRGSMYNRMKEYDKAIADYDRAIELDPNYASVYYYKATALEGKQAYDDAVKAYEEFLKRADASLSRRIEDAKQRIQAIRQ